MRLLICRYTIALAYSSSMSAATIYINGVKDARCGSISLHPAKLAPFTNAFIGKSQFATDSYLSAELTSFMVYTSALT